MGTLICQLSNARFRYQVFEGEHSLSIELICYGSDLSLFFEHYGNDNARNTRLESLAYDLIKLGRCSLGAKY